MPAYSCTRMYNNNNYVLAAHKWNTRNKMKKRRGDNKDVRRLHAWADAAVNQSPSMTQAFLNGVNSTDKLMAKMYNWGIQVCRKFDNLGGPRTLTF